MLRGDCLLDALDVDRVFVIAFTGYPDRLARFQAGLSDAGLADRRGLTVIYRYPNPCATWVLDRLPHSRNMDNRGRKQPFANNAVGHYYAVKTGLELGCRRIVVMEDDARLLRDYAVLYDAFHAQLPDDGEGLYRLDSDVWLGDPVETRGPWTAWPSARSAACYVAGRLGMERLVQLWESPVDSAHKRAVLRQSDHWWNQRYYDRFKVWTAFPNLAIQVPTDGPSTCGSNHSLKFYCEKNIDIDRYFPY